MKKLFFLSIFMVFILSSAFCFPSVPKWFINLEDEFPSNDYIRAKGEGSSVMDAKKDAIAELSSFFAQKVTAKTYGKDFKSQKDSAYSSISSINQDITVSSNSELFAVCYTDIYYNKKENKYFVCAYINKTEAFNIISQKISSYERLFDQKLEFLQKENDNFIKIIILNDALSNEKGINTLYDFLVFLDYQKSKEFDEFIALLNETKYFLFNLKRNNPVSITSIGDYSEQIKSIIFKILMENGFVISEKANYKISSSTFFDITEQNKIYSCVPTISIVIERKGEMISSHVFSSEKFSSYNKQTLLRKLLLNIEVLLHEKFIQSL